jgi:signal transduction histidine kinase
MLRALRQAEGGEVNQDTVSLGTAPGLADLERLVAQTARAGVQAEVRWSGPRRPLPPAVDQSAYRIVQEAVTNVVRHSGADGCRIDIGFGQDGVDIEIVDEGRGAGGRGGRPGGVGAASGGFGLLGMHERVAMLSGRFSAGPLDSGGFRVAAHLPIRTPARLPAPAPLTERLPA